MSAMKFAGIRQVCPFLRFSRLLLRIASKAKRSGWAILSAHEFSKLPHRWDRRKNSPGESASIANHQIRRDQRIKSPGVSLA